MILQTNTLYIMSGTPASGKSSFFKNNNIPSSMIVSPDKIREELMGVTYKIDDYGVYESLDQEYNNIVFDIVRKTIESKAKEGLTIFLDATNPDDMTRKDYVKIAEKLNMESKILIFGDDLTIEQIKENNSNRTKRVPNYVIDKIYDKMEFTSKFDFELVKFNTEYKLEPKFKISSDIELTVIGDVHGLYDELEKLLKKEDFYIENNTIKHNDKNKKVLFLGDIIDRGEHSIKMLNLVKNSILNENHYMILGNHENKFLRLYEKYNNKENTNLFETSEAVSRTFGEFLKLSRKEQESLYNFYSKLPFYYVYNDNLIVHANIISGNIETLKRSYALYGEEDPKCDLKYDELYSQGINKYKLIRGHVPLFDKTNSVISLEEEAISYGYLCMLNAKTNELFKEKCDFNYEKSSHFYNGRKFIYHLKSLENYEIDILDKQNNPTGKTKNISLVSYKENETGDLRIYKYGKQVFFKNLWHLDPALLKARGLVLDSNGNIVQHPFTKVFNFNENGSGLNISNDTTVYAVEKLNGFLGCITIHNNELLVTTTGSFDSDFVGYIKDFFMNKEFDHYNPKLHGNLMKFLRNENLTLMFEVIHPNDPHIIKYEKEEMGLKLIGARGKQFNSKELKEERLDFIANEIGVVRAKYFKVKFGELKEIVKDSKLEGFMVRDVNTQETLLKFKTPFYLTTKFIGRMSNSNIEFMYGSPNKFKEKVDEEYYELVDLIVNNVDKKYFLEANNLDKIALVRDLINNERDKLENINKDFTKKDEIKKEKEDFTGFDRD